MSKKFLGLAIVWFSVTTFLLCIPGKKLPKINWFNIYQVDKVVHFAIFLLLTLLFYKAFSQVGRAKKILFFVALLCSIYGAVMEFVQDNYIPNRSFDIWDIVADTLGSFCVFPLLKFRLESFIYKTNFKSR